MAQSLDLSVRGSAWTSDRSDTTQNGILSGEVWIRARAPIGETARLQLEGWAGDSKGADLRADLREAMLVLGLGEAELRAGRQVIVWGRADRINPTDIAAVRDLRRLTVDDGDDRLGLGAVSLSIPHGDGAFELYWLPEHRVSEPPAAVPPGLSVRDAPLDEEAAQGALRYDRSGGRIDWSVTLASVLDRSPWLSPAPGGIVRSYPRLTMLGADAATTVGDWGVRLEAAAYRHDFETAPVARMTPTAFASLGADRKFIERIDVNVQLLVRLAERSDVAVPPALATLAARNEILHGAWNTRTVGAAGRLKVDLFNDQGYLEVSGVTFDGGGATLQTRLSWSPRDNWRASLGADAFEGDPDQLFGAVKRNKTLFMELRRGF